MVLPWLTSNFDLPQLRDNLLGSQRFLWHFPVPCLFMLLILLHSEVIDHELCRWRSPKARLVTRVIGKPAREQKYDGTGRSRIMG
jgi:hypothetical protein